MTDSEEVPKKKRGCTSIPRFCDVHEQVPYEDERDRQASKGCNQNAESYWNKPSRYRHLESSNRCVQMHAH